MSGRTVILPWQDVAKAMMRHLYVNYGYEPGEEFSIRPTSQGLVVAPHRAGTETKPAHKIESSDTTGKIPYPDEAGRP